MNMKKPLRILARAKQFIRQKRAVPTARSLTASRSLGESVLISFLVIALFLVTRAWGQEVVHETFPEKIPIDPQAVAKQADVQITSPQSKTIYVDFANWGGDENGSPAHPYSTVTKGYAVAMSGDTIVIRAGRYPETLTFSTATTIRGEGGIVTVGRTRVRVPGFLPSTSGFHFSNSTFPHVPDLTIDVLGQQIPIGDAANGLCGGMAFTVRDFYEAHAPPPPDTTNPSSGRLFDYLVRRLFDSFNLTKIPPGPTTYMFLMDPALPDHETDASRLGLAPHGRAWVMINDQWPKIKNDLESGTLSPLGLIEIKSLNPFDLGHNHQVLAYGYDVNGTDLTIHFYDPNHPDNDNVTMSLSIANPQHTTPVTYSTGETVWCFFRPDYTFSSPPRLPSTLIWAVDSKGAVRRSF